jgi:hypothetical protein
MKHPPLGSRLMPGFKLGRPLSFEIQPGTYLTWSSLFASSGWAKTVVREAGDEHGPGLWIERDDLAGFYDTDPRFDTLCWATMPKESKPYVPKRKQYRFKLVAGKVVFKPFWTEWKDITHEYNSESASRYLGEVSCLAEMGWDFSVEFREFEE